MSRSSSSRVPAVPLALCALAGVSLALAGGGVAAGIVEHPAAWLALAVLGAVGALHRPLGGRTLGVGALALPAAAAIAGPAAAGWAAAVALLAADGVRALAMRRLPGGAPGAEDEAAPVSARAAAAARAALAALAAFALGWRWPSIGPEGLAALPLAGAVALYLGVSVALDAAAGWLDADRPAPRPRDFAPYLLDAAALVVGTLAAWAGFALGGWVAAVLLAAPALLAGEAARAALGRRAVLARLAGVERMRRAGERIIEPTRGLEPVVDRIRAECARVVGPGWFQLELVEGGAPAGRQVWSAAPDGPLEPGPAVPPAAPPPLPGIHRGAAWRVVERELSVAPGGGDDPETSAGADDPGSATAAGGTAARLTLWCDPRRLEPRDLELLAALAPQMAASLRQALLDREARQDGLTGAAVRRVLERRLFEAFSAACERGGRVAVVLCDVDRFKRINDTFGHAAGDRALAAVAGALAAAKREPDLLARYGGEELALLLVDTDGETALGIAERLRQRVAELQVGEDDRRMKLTVSVGAAAFPEVHVKTASELLLLADEALYEAKRRGRNRCLLHVGGGRYRTPKGGVVEAADPPPEVQPPRLFA